MAPRHKSPSQAQKYRISDGQCIVDEVKQAISQAFQPIAACPNLGDLIDAMDTRYPSNQIAQRFFPPVEKMDGRVSAQPEFQQITKKMWNSYRLFRHCHVACLGHVLCTWRRRQWAAFQRASKAMKQQAKQTKQRLILDVMHRLEVAAEKKDLHQVYTQAKRLAPWKPTGRSNLRGANGQILSPHEQVAELQRHFKANSAMLGHSPSHIA